MGDIIIIRNRLRTVMESSVSIVLIDSFIMITDNLISLIGLCLRAILDLPVRSYFRSFLIQLGITWQRPVGFITPRVLLYFNT